MMLDADKEQIFQRPHSFFLSEFTLMDSNVDRFPAVYSAPAFFHQPLFFVFAGKENEGTMGEESTVSSGSQEPPVQEAAAATVKRTSSDDDVAKVSPKKRWKPNVVVSKTATTTTSNAAAAPPPVVKKVDQDEVVSAADLGSSNSSTGRLWGFSVPPPDGSRLAVHWDITLVDNDDDVAGADHVDPSSNTATADEAAVVSSSSNGTTTYSFWWKATLLPHDGRLLSPSTVADHKNAFAIRVLEYDALPAWGYPERSCEDVILVSNKFLLRYDDEDVDDIKKIVFSATSVVDEEVALEYKVLSSDDNDDPDQVLLETFGEDDNDVDDDDDDAFVVCRDEADIESLVNDTLTASFHIVAQKFQQMPASVQAVVAENIAKKKDRLVQLLRQHVQQHRIVSEQDMRSLLAQAIAAE
jgi:hypothetical protein